MPLRIRNVPLWVVHTIIASCQLVVAMQFTLTIPLLPDLPALLDVSSAHASWLVTAALLTSAVSTLIVAKMAEMYGKRLMSIIALTVMIVGSLLCAMSTEFVLLIIGRSMQGFASLLTAVVLAPLVHIDTLIPAARAATPTLAREHEAVARGSVQVGVSDHSPARPAIVPALILDGEQVDWNRTYMGGPYLIALPGPDLFLRTATAQGRTPTSKIVEYGETLPSLNITLQEELSIWSQSTLRHAVPQSSNRVHPYRGTTRRFSENRRKRSLHTPATSGWPLRTNPRRSGVPP